MNRVGAPAAALVLAQAKVGRLCAGDCAGALFTDEIGKRVT